MNRTAPRSGLLVFPALQEMSLDEPRLALGPSDELVLASSLLSEYHCDDGVLPVFRLPSIHDSGFGEAFHSLIKEHRIGKVFSPVTSVYVAVERTISKLGLDLAMVGQSPHARILSLHRHVRLRAKIMQATARQFSNDGVDPINLLDATALLTLTSPVYGESNDQKFAGFAAALQSAPAGDVVEIGALMGKSAVALAFLAGRFDVGSVLAVDPWLRESAVQHDSPALIKQLAGAWDLEEVFQIFQENAAMLPIGRIAHLRATSVKAAQEYATASRQNSASATGLLGRIALLHVDGNHDVAHVRADCRAWFDFLLPDGWIVLDDYEWAHGLGPRVVGDEILEVCSGDIRRSFKAGKALFLQVREGAALRQWALARV